MLNEYFLFKEDLLQVIRKEKHLQTSLMYFNLKKN